LSIKQSDIKKMPQWAQDQIQEQCNAEATRATTTRDTNPKSKRGERETLGVEGKAPGFMVSIDCPVFVRITRISPRQLDDDNLSGGCKELRDAIAASLGRKGDSEKDGMKWEYKQEKGDHATRVEIFKEEV